MTKKTNLQKQPPELFCKKKAFEKFCKFYRKTPVLESLFNKVASLMACNEKETIKKRLQHRCFPVNIVKFLRTPILVSILQVMCVRDFRPSILACKDYKINTKTSKILAFILILFFSVIRLLGLFTLCSHATKFSSLGISVLLSYI